MDCDLCHGLRGPSPPSMIFKIFIKASQKELEASAKRGCPLCNIFRQAVASELLQESVPPDEEVTVVIAKYYTEEVCLHVYWEGANEYDPQITISFYVDKGDPGSANDIFSSRKHIIRDSGSEEAIALAEKWLYECITNTAEHANCCARPGASSSSPPKLPTRVVDVGAWDGSTPPRLVESNGAAGTYIALSHCWGKKQIITTTGATLADRKRAIAWTALSKTFQDAITVARRLRIRHVWIDSLCIVQDSRADWAAESARMGDIYERAHCTLAATASSGGDGGLFLARAPPASYALQIPDNSGPHAGAKATTTTRRAVTVFAHRQPPHDSFTRRQQASPQAAPLLSRAWVYQERVLSTRLVHFGGAELVFECKSAHACECGGIERLTSPFSQSWGFKQRYAGVLSGSPGAVPGGLGDRKLLWEDLVREYSACALTFDGDRLPALGSTAARLWRVWGREEDEEEGREGGGKKERGESRALGTYLAGLWERTLPEALFWHANAYKFAHPAAHMVDANAFWMPARASRAERRPPSWSWASVEEAVVDVHYKLKDPRVRVLAAETETVGPDPFGAVTQGSIKVAGPLLWVACEVQRKVPEQSQEFLHYVLRGGGCEVRFLPDVEVSPGEGKVNEEAGLYCLLGGGTELNGLETLVLKKKDAKLGTFQRVGVIRDGPWEWGSHAKETTITLV